MNGLRLARPGDILPGMTLTSRLYTKNGYVVARDPADDLNAASVAGSFNGRDVATPKGRALASGLIMLTAETWVTGKTSHELEIVASKVEGLEPGMRVIVYIGGDTEGAVSANGISAFPKIDGKEYCVVPEAFIWAVIKDGEVLPRGSVILTERDDDAFRQHAVAPGALIHLPDAVNQSGMSATGSDSTHPGDQYAVSALYEKVYRVGPKVTDLARGETVCFSPSFSSARLKRGKQSFHLVASEEVFFVVGA